MPLSVFGQSVQLLYFGIIVQRNRFSVLPPKVRLIYAKSDAKMLLTGVYAARKAV